MDSIVWLLGLWGLGRTGRSRNKNSLPRTWYAPYSAVWLDFRSDGQLIERTISRVRRGTWQLAEGGVAVNFEFRDPETLTMHDGQLVAQSIDEEHGGFLFSAYAPDTPPGPNFAADVAQRLSRSKDPRALIEKRGWLLRALWEGRVDLLRLCMQSGCEFSPGRLAHLNDCPPGRLPAMLDVLLASPGALGSEAFFRVGGQLKIDNFTGYLAHHASADVIQQVRTRRPGAQRIADGLVAHLATETFLIGDGLPALLAAVETADLRDEKGVPLIVHAVLKARPEAVRLILAKASADARLLQAARLAGEWGAIDVPAGADAKHAAALVLAALEQLEANGSTAPWRTALIQTVRENVALLP